MKKKKKEEKNKAKQNKTFSKFLCFKIVAGFLLNG
jgi:hypothetical protein